MFKIEQDIGCISSGNDIGIKRHKTEYNCRLDVIWGTSDIAPNRTNSNGATETHTISTHGPRA